MEEKKIEREVIDEWEKKLRMLTSKYEDDLRRKKDKSLERVMKREKENENEDLTDGKNVFFCRN